ncbi:hypothetical protein N9D31_02680, partial [Oligoflexaceae bacterium]|nr:hypothetical protein [Oligoflexaceae bacterium]
FQPIGKKEYRQLGRAVRDFYAVTKAEQKKQFIGVGEAGNQGFNFSGISVNGSDPYSYSGYFYDLLAVFSKTTSGHILGGASERSLRRRESVQSMQSTIQSVRTRNGLGSMIFK